MKKLLITCLIVGGSFTFISCANEECICFNNDGTESAFGEDDISTNSLQDACDDQDQVLKDSNLGTCSIEES